MNKSLKTIKQENSKTLYYSSLVAVFAVVFALHFLAKPLLNDDAWFASILEKYSFSEYIVWRYETWTSRLLLEGMLVLLAQINIWVFRVLDTIMVLWVVASLRELLGLAKTGKSIMTIALVIAFVPLRTLYSAGWIATSANYLWPLAFGLYGLLPICRILRSVQGEACRFRKWEYVTFSLAILISANQEQMAALLFGFHITFFAVRLLQKKHISEREFVLPLILFFIIILSLVFALACPGNEIRNAAEVINWFPQYASDYNLFEKFAMGFIATMSYYVAGLEGQILLLLFTVVLALAVLDKEKTKKTKVSASAAFLGFFPVAVTFVLGFLGQEVLSRLNIKAGRMNFYYELFQNPYLPQHDLCNYETWHVVFEGICYSLLILWICMLLYRMYGKTLQTFIWILILAAGFASRFVMGFSATIYASGFRTALYCTTSMMAAEIYFVSGIRNQKIKKTAYILIILLLAVTIFFETNGVQCK